MQQLFNTRNYSVRDFEEWDERNELVLAPKFQRREVWSAKARSYLIDTIIRGKPIPKLYMRQNVAPSTRRTTREIVDGAEQQSASRSLEGFHDRLQMGTERAAGKGVIRGAPAVFCQLPLKRCTVARAVARLSLKPLAAPVSKYAILEFLVYAGLKASRSIDRSALSWDLVDEVLQELDHRARVTRPQRCEGVAAVVQGLRPRRSSTLADNRGLLS